MPTFTAPPPDTAVDAQPSIPATSSTGAAAWRAYHHAGTPDFTLTRECSETDFIERHLPLVKTVVGRMRIYLPPHLEAEDLHSVGLTGLISAVRKYDPAQGHTFHGYAALCIRGAVLDELRRLDWMPRGLRAKAKQLRDTLASLESESGRAVTEEEAAAALGLGLHEYHLLLDEVRPVTFVSIDDDANEDGDGISLHETIADRNQPLPGDSLEHRELLEIVADHIQRLPDTQRKVLALYYYGGLRLAEIAVVFGVTESRISQIHTQAVIALRAFVRRAMDR